MATYPHPFDRPPYPPYPGWERVTTGFQDTINERAIMRYPKWGFVIYRGTYSDDVAWEKCVALLKRSANIWLRRSNQADVLGPDLVWTVIEDRDTLDGAPKDTVRDLFNEWAAARSVERDGPGVDAPWIPRLCPRFRYCVYIDQVCLDSMTARWIDVPREHYWNLYGQVAIINGRHDETKLQYDLEELAEELGDDFDPEDWGPEDNPPIEGDTAEDVGWRYADASLLISHYEALHLMNGSEYETWRYFYRAKRPYAPDVPANDRFEPLATVDLSRTDEVRYLSY